MKDSRLESLIPAAQLSAHKWLHIITDDLGLKVRVTETLRDAARQAEVAAAGTSGLLRGFHNLGRAMDWACFDDSGIYITDGSHPYYRKCGLIWQALGWNWGGTWAKADSDHAQLSDGIDSFQEWLKDHPEAIVN